jgi:uncharacterized protein YjeT (DUF2065 family)
VGRFTLLVAAGLVASSLHLPWRAGALVFLGAALVVGVMALVAAVRAAARPAAVVAICLGLAATALILVLEGLALLLWPVTSQTQECLADALTQSARQACTADQQQSLEDFLRRAAG